MRNSLMSNLAVLLVLLLLPAATYAQSNSNIGGVVRDSSGAVLPGVTVEAASPVLIEKVRTVVTDSAGRYQVINLVPGTYSVTFTLPGFTTVKRDGILLTASFTANVNVDMQVGNLEETLTVTGEASTVDVQSVVTQKVVTRDVLDAVPTGSRSVVNLGVLIPGVVVNNQDVGGSAFTSSQIAIHGGRPGEQQLLYDGMMYNNGQGRGGQYTAIATNDGTVQEISLETSGLGAESEMSGIRTNIVPKEGGNTFRGTVAGAFTNDSLQSDNLTDEFRAQGLLSVNTVRKIYDINPGLGGPIMKDKLWFYVSVRAWSAQQYVAGMFYNQSPVPWRYEADTSQPALNIETNGNESLRLTWQAASKHKITGQYQYGQQDRPFYGYSLGQTLASPEAAYASKSIPSYLGQVGWNSPMTNKILLEAGAAVANKNFFTFLQPIAGNNPSYQESSTGNFWGNSRSTYGQNATWQMNTRASASYVTGSHNAKVGFTVQHQESYTTQEISNNGTLLTLLNGQPRMVTVWATPLLLREINKANVGLYAQDQWTIRNMTLNLGLRYD
ncbi:MAG TPA: carboxypeptidase regulatory-like domain-containing protein, partial [Vicinamibacterales bacterium]|nr:carboxypeptidase regulatory-like domain-containing protein [Vicinamibacterales bacterium]